MRFRPGWGPREAGVGRRSPYFRGMHPVYETISFCTNPETLWRKLEEGRWDWLGVHPKGQYVLGSPRRKGGAGFPIAGVVAEGVSRSRSRVLAGTGRSQT